MWVIFAEKFPKWIRVVRIDFGLDKNASEIAKINSQKSSQDTGVVLAPFWT